MAFNSTLSNKSNICKWCFLSVMVLPTPLFGQSVLKLDEAVSIAMEQNFGVQISTLEQTIDEKGIYKANAGIGPVIDLNSNFRTTGNNVNQTFLDGREVNRWGRSINPSADISLNLTLYNGGRMRATYQGLKMLGEYGEIEKKLIVQSTLVEVMVTYFDIVKYKKTLTYLNSIIEYYNERLKITDQRWQVGKGSKLDYLQSKTDLNAQLSEVTRAKNNLKNAKVVLNGLLNRHPSVDFKVEESERIPSNYKLSNLEEQAINQNRDIVLLQKALEISYKEEQEVSSARKPQVFLNGSAGYSYIDTNTGFLSNSQNLAGIVGLSARWNLFNGRHTKNQVAISRIRTQIIEKQQENLEAQIINELNLAFNQYQSDKELLEFEQVNKAIAEENLSISLEKFRLGGSSILVLSEAQRAYDTALNRLVNSEYNVKISELTILRLSGSLVE
jgi:outer membrane protein